MVKKRRKSSFHSIHLTSEATREWLAFALSFRTATISRGVMTFRSFSLRLMKSNEQITVIFSVTCHHEIQHNLVYKSLNHAKKKIP